MLQSLNPRLKSVPDALILLFTIRDLIFPPGDSLFTARRTLTFAVRVAPRASRSEISGEHDGALRVSMPRPPVDGAANRELTRVMAEH